MADSALSGPDITHAFHDICFKMDSSAFVGVNQFNLMEPATPIRVVPGSSLR